MRITHQSCHQMQLPIMPHGVKVISYVIHRPVVVEHQPAHHKTTIQAGMNIRDIMMRMNLLTMYKVDGQTIIPVILQSNPNKVMWR